MKQINGTMIQYFEWYLSTNQNFWNDIVNKSKEIKENGFTSIWLPPAYKGIGGKDEVGYGVYDVYDLGEFEQKGTIKTKYGSKDEYIQCIKELEKNGIEVYADIVLNHKMGADAFQTIPAIKVDSNNHTMEISSEEFVKVATKFTFPGRNNKYSDFKWNWTHFDGVDYNDNNKEYAVYKFKNKNWDEEVDDEYGNYDYLMGADLDFGNREVVEECERWGEWYINLTKIDGFRLDAVKHIPASFYKEWLSYLREKTKRNLFTFGEYWSGDVNKLHTYIKETDGMISLLDVPLHYNFYEASENDQYDLSKIFKNTLVEQNSLKAITFVDNHDTQPGQSLESFVYGWFKIPAYALILLRQEGYPCVFYGDYYGIPHNNIEKNDKLQKLINVRAENSYGEQIDYFDNQNYIGWTRCGDSEHEKSSLAVVISNSNDGEKIMYIGKEKKGKVYIDVLENCTEEVVINEDGVGIFKVKGHSASVWIQKL